MAAMKEGNNPGAPEKRPTAIIVGAGIGGVSCAARLQLAGFDVTVIEKNSFIGGRCSLLHDPHTGHRFDQGPSLLLLPKLFHETFADLGTSLSAEGIGLRKCEPNYRIFFSDGEKIEMSSDLAEMKAEIERVEGRDAWAGYLGFLKESGMHYDISYEHVLKRNFEGYTSMLRWGFIKRVLDLHVFESVYTRASKYFKSERLRQVFTFASMYLGMSPYDAPGTYSLLQYTELAEGIWYPVGGFNVIPTALANISQRHGARYLLNTTVSKVLIDPSSKRATGVLLSNGTTLSSNTVILNADLVHSYNNLLPSSNNSTTTSQTSASRYAQSLAEKSHSCSSISLYWSLSTLAPPSLSTHNIFLADKSYRSSFDAIFKQNSLPDQPSFYINIPSRIDPSASPPGTDSLIVLIPCGHLTPLTSSPNYDWTPTITQLRETVLSTVKNRTGIDISPYITNEMVNTPTTWSQKFNLHKGAILGLNHDFWNVLALRPRTRYEEGGVEGVYFVGASTHPGTGVPICLAGGKVVSEQVCKDRGVGVPWESNEEFHARIRKERRVVGGWGWRESGWYWRGLSLVMLMAVVWWLGIWGVLSR